MWLQALPVTESLVGPVNETDFAYRQWFIYNLLLYTTVIWCSVLTYRTSNHVGGAPTRWRSLARCMGHSLCWYGTQTFPCLSLRPAPVKSLRSTRTWSLATWPTYSPPQTGCARLCSPSSTARDSYTRFVSSEFVRVVGSFALVNTRCCKDSGVTSLSARPSYHPISHKISLHTSM